ncbi:hypothetical protein OAQ99_04735 [Candidatus Kapabacteria bacterium]|nr:hypothetical protein [Candidatus Kapabacteria bacterium]
MLGISNKISSLFNSEPKNLAENAKLEDEIQRIAQLLEIETNKSIVLQKQYDELSAKHNMSLDGLQNLGYKIELRDARIIELENSNDSMSEITEKLKACNEEITIELQNKESELDALFQLHENQKTNISALADINANLEDANSNLVNVLETKDVTIKKLEDSNKQTASELKVKEAELESVTQLHENQKVNISALVEENNSLQALLTVKNEECQDSYNMIESLEYDVDFLQSRNHSLELANEDLESSNSEMNLKIDKLWDELQQYKSLSIDRGNKLRKAVSQISNLTKRNESLNKSLKGQRSKHSCHKRRVTKFFKSFANGFNNNLDILELIRTGGSSIYQWYRRNNNNHLDILNFIPNGSTANDIHVIATALYPMMTDLEVKNFRRDVTRTVKLLILCKRTGRYFHSNRLKRYFR